MAEKRIDFKFFGITAAAEAFDKLIEASKPVSSPDLGARRSVTTVVYHPGSRGESRRVVHVPQQKNNAGTA